MPLPSAKQEAEARQECPRILSGRFLILDMFADSGEFCSLKSLCCFEEMVGGRRYCEMYTGVRMWYCVEVCSRDAVGR